MTSRSALLVLALGAALVCAGSSQAATIVFDVSSASAERIYRTLGYSYPDHHETAFSAGSSLTLETDANNDGVSGDYTVASSHFVIQGSFRSPASDYGFGETGLRWDVVGELSGGRGRLEDYLGIYEYIAWIGSASYSATGTWECYGWACELSGLPTDVPMPYDEMLAFMGMEPIEEIQLGSWITDGPIPTRFDTSCFDSYPNACHTTTEAAFPLTALWDVDGNPLPFMMLHVEGQALPEPAAALVTAGGFLALALRRRASDTMRRHEAT